MSLVQSFIFFTFFLLFFFFISFYKKYSYILLFFFLSEMISYAAFQLATQRQIHIVSNPERVCKVTQDRCNTKINSDPSKKLNRHFSTFCASWNLLSSYNVIIVYAGYFSMLINRERMKCPDKARLENVREKLETYV